MKKMIRNGLVLISSITLLIACVVSKSDHAVLSMTLEGGADTIGSVSLNITLPEGFILPTVTVVGGFATDPEVFLDDGVVKTSIPDGYVMANYTPEDSSNLGQLQLYLVSAGGFMVGEFCTLVKKLDSDEELPLLENFEIVSLTVKDLDGVELSGYNVSLTMENQRH